MVKKVLEFCLQIKFNQRESQEGLENLDQRASQVAAQQVNQVSNQKQVNPTGLAPTDPVNPIQQLNPANLALVQRLEKTEREEIKAVARDQPETERQTEEIRMLQTGGETNQSRTKGKLKRVLKKVAVREKESPPMKSLGGRTEAFLQRLTSEEEKEEKLSEKEEKSAKMFQRKNQILLQRIRILISQLEGNSDADNNRGNQFYYPRQNL